MKNTTQVKIRMNELQKIKKFVDEMSRYQEKILAKSLDGEYCVNAKSILGLFSLDLERPIVIEFEDNARIEGFLQPYKA